MHLERWQGIEHRNHSMYFGKGISVKNRDKNVWKNKGVIDISEKFSIHLYTDSLSFWHEKLVICRTYSVYVIYYKGSCLNGPPGSISLSSNLSLHSDPLCGYTAVVHFVDFVLLFPRNWGLFLSDAIKYHSLRTLAAFSVPLDSIADTLAHHLAVDFFFLSLCSWKNSLSRMKIKRKNLMCYE